MEESDWTVLINKIEDGECTPFLGAGINYGILPLGGELAREWAAENHYPLKDCDDLARVAQYVAVKYRDARFPKSQILKRFRSVQVPSFASNDERLEGIKAIAELPFPVYLTTNYDSLLMNALKFHDKAPKRELCRWNSQIKKQPSVFDGREGFAPNAANPVVFHLHGHEEVVESLVLTEDDYLDFLVNASRNMQKLVPPRIQEAISDSLLFIGYRLKDINFRVLFRGLVQSMEVGQRSLSVAVQISPPDDHVGDPNAAVDYMTRYFGNQNIQIYWGTAQSFARELRDRWRTFHGRGASAVV
jgi:SIR2-like protein